MTKPACIFIAVGIGSLIIAAGLAFSTGNMLEKAEKKEQEYKLIPVYHMRGVPASFVRVNLKEE